MHTFPKLPTSLLLLLLSATLAAGVGAQDLTINEIMYHPPDEGAVVGDEYEFLEIKNVGEESINLAGLFFGAGIDYTFQSGSILGPGEIIVLASNPAQFQAKYGFAPFGAYVGRLDNSGERLALMNQQGAVVQEVTYSDRWPWPPAADGHGFSLVPIDASGSADQNDPANWRLSAAIGGSPGEDDESPVVEPVVYVNELLAHTDPPQQDAVELHNPNNTTVNISGWYLTDTFATPKGYQFPAGSTIPPGGYLVLTEEDFNAPGDPDAFGFSSLGEEVYIFSADDAGELTGHAHGFSFGASENQVSFGRHVNSVGVEQFVPQRSLTFGQANAGPRPSPVVISEIMYNPPVGVDEFLEIVNVSDGTVPLYDPDVPENTWRIDGLMYDLPAGLQLTAGEVLLVVPIDPETFRARYGLPSDLKIVGPYPGALNNGGEKIEIEKPDPPNQDGTIPYIAIDVVEYHDREPWPVAADGEGYSLERIDLEAYADDPENWRASRQVGGSPGEGVPTDVERTEDVGLANTFTLSPAYPNPFNPITRMSFIVRDGQDVQVALYDALGRRIQVLFEGYATAGSRYELEVDGASLAGGVYVVRLEAGGFAGARAVVLVK